MELIRKTAPYVIFIGVISFVVSWIFQFSNTLIISETSITGMTYYKFNFVGYVNNLANARNTDALDFQKILPPNITNYEWGILKNVFNWLIFPINFLLYFIRWFAWLILLGLALIGWSVGKNANGEYISVLAQILNWILVNLQIPYLT